ncbi:MAG: ATP-dependent protease [marine bacterium B5-7]|nr:MAG: ATP-dependent protease [marine bacterium B5-7]
MTHNLFTPKFENLPDVIPVFPLPGAILMPGTQLPLNIFEPRYLRMLNDVLSNDRIIGIVQPDSRSRDDEVVCNTGCAGRITSFNETDDGRFIVLLSGLCRFDLVAETTDGTDYRTFRVDWSRFQSDYDLEQSLDGLSTSRDALLKWVREFGSTRNAEVDFDSLGKLNDLQVVNVLICGLGFEPPSVQGLIESVSLTDRADLLSGLLRIASMNSSDPGHHTH